MQQQPTTTATASPKPNEIVNNWIYWFEEKRLYLRWRYVCLIEKCIFTHNQSTNKAAIHWTNISFYMVRVAAHFSRQITSYPLGMSFERENYMVFAHLWLKNVNTNRPTHTHIHSRSAVDLSTSLPQPIDGRVSMRFNAFSLCVLSLIFVLLSLIKLRKVSTQGTQSRLCAHVFVLSVCVQMNGERSRRKATSETDIHRSTNS